MQMVSCDTGPDKVPDLGVGFQDEQARRPCMRSVKRSRAALALKERETTQAMSDPAPGPPGFKLAMAASGTDNS